MFFTYKMSKKRIYIYITLVIATLLIWLLSTSNNTQEEFSESVKVALRGAGNELLLSNNDLTSLVQPIVKISTSKYQLTFESQLSIEPDYLVNSIKQNFDKANLPKYYRVEVVECNKEEVAYSYQVTDIKEKDIIPCKGRTLPLNCYTVQLRFVKLKTPFITKQTVLFILFFIGFVFALDYLLHKKKAISKIENNVTLNTNSDDSFKTLGVFRFYPEQHKLIKDPLEIKLSKKECELLSIFVENLNQVVTRDDLTKKVWEDNGVIVGRSLDTYISKLRKKLKDDDSIKITNVHGIGYKLEIEG